MFVNSRNYERLLKQLQTSSTQSKSLTVALLDIDHFHKVNIHHSVEERVETVCSILSESLSAAPIYLGRDEFAIIQPDQRAEDLFMRLMMTKDNLKQKYEMTFSAGVAEYPKNGNDWLELLRHLEETVYQIKQEGRDRISFIVESKMKLKSNYYTLTQLDRLAKLSQQLGRSEASLLRESLDVLFRTYED